LLFVRSRMPPSRQERRKAEREAAKRAPARAGAAGAAGAAAALGNLYVNVNPPLGDWTTQAKDANALFDALGPQMVKQRAAAGDREAQYSLGFALVAGAGGVGKRLGTGDRSPQSDEGVALLEKAAGQGHVYAMHALGSIHNVRKEHEQSVEWNTKAAEAGLPDAMFNLGCCLDNGEGAAALGWYRRAADAGHGQAAANVSAMYTVGAGGVTRSKRRAMQWRRKAADKGVVDSCTKLARDMYRDMPHARAVGLVDVEVTGVAMSAGDMEGHDVPPDVLTSVVYWLRKGCVAGGPSVLDYLEAFRRVAVEGFPYCDNDGCEVVGQVKDFKVCPRCKIARYCSDSCQKHAWTAGEHKAKCGTIIERGA
jgi:TPR repeat protein